MHLVTYLEFLQTSERALGDSFGVVSHGHTADADVHWTTANFAQRCAAHAEALTPVLARYEAPAEPVPERLHAQGMASVRSGPAGLLRDLQDLYQLANHVDITWTLIGQSARATRDRDLIRVTDHCAEETTAQLDWIRMRLKATAPQTLVVAT